MKLIDFKDIVAYWMIYYNHKFFVKLNKSNLFPCRVHDKTLFNTDFDIPKDILFRYYSSDFIKLIKLNLIINLLILI